MNLIFSCNDTLDQPTTPVCTTDYGNRITTLIFSKAAITMAGNQPTSAEIRAAYTNDLCTIIWGCNGKRAFIGEEEVNILYKEWYDKQYVIEGKIRLMSESVIRLTEKLNRYRGLYLYYITDKNYCFGGVKTNPAFDVVINGAGDPIYIHFKLEFFSGIDYAQYDTSYNVAGDWILKTGSWDDDGIWIDTEKWKDA